MLALAFSLVYCCAFGQPHRAASMAATLLALFSSCFTPINSRGGDVSLYWSIREKPFRGQGQPQCITTGLVGFPVLLMDTSAVGVHNWVKNSNKQAVDHQMNFSDCIDLSRRLLNIESDMPDLPFKHVLTCTCPLELFAELLRCSAQPSNCEKTTVFKETAGPWRCTTKPEFIDELCVSKLSGQQEFIETLKSLSAITGIFFNHYHSSETACPVLKLIQVLSVCRPSQHLVDSRWVIDPRWFI